MGPGDPLWHVRLPAILGTIGLIGLLVLDWDRRLVAVDELSAVRLLGRVQADAAVAHVWIEEQLSEDRIDVEDLDFRLQRLGESAVLLERGPWADEERRDRLRALRADVEQFRQITEDRLQGRLQGLDVGIGSAFDVEYDRVFNRLLDRAERLENAFELRRSESENRHALWFRLLLGLCAVAALAAAWAYVRRELDRRRVERELARAEEDLQRAQKIDVLGRLAGGLAHDVNNYLAAVRSQCELLEKILEDRRPGDDPARSLRMIVGAATRAGALIDRLLAFGSGARPSVGGASVGTLVEAMAPMLEASTPDGVTLAVDLPEDLWPVAVDADRLEQVILNLVLNAADAVGERGRVEITATRRPGGLADAETGAADAEDPRAEDAVELVVRDDGRGISAEDLPHIFEPFWSTKIRRGEVGGHAGLGLAVVQSVIQGAGGRLAVESEPGRGTEIRILLPRSSVVEGSSGPEPSTADDLSGDETVLLIDDHEELRESTAMLLETLGYEVWAVAGVAEAEERMAESVPDALIVDLSLKDADGLAWLLGLRRRLGPLPAVIYTGTSIAALGERAERCAELGLPVVSKGASTRELLVALRRVLVGNSRSDG